MSKTIKECKILLLFLWSLTYRFWLALPLLLPSLLSFLFHPHLFLSSNNKAQSYSHFVSRYPSPLFCLLTSLALQSNSFFDSQSLYSSENNSAPLEGHLHLTKWFLPFICNCILAVGLHLRTSDMNSTPFLLRF